ncbi:hypothetical protein CLOP_g8533 [Closterium sp. NIES-67]|nr:hypothetical protein CLOP_g8533 [Closterium sp. NIES-67]
MVEDVHGHEGDVGSVGKVVMHPLTHWVIDSGCTSHMTPQADLLDEVKPPGKIKYVAAASGALLPVIGVGNAKVKGANGELVGLGNVLLVEGLSANLLSVRRLQKSKAEVTFGPTSCRAKLGKKMDIVTAFLNGIILEEVYMKQPEGLDDGSGRVCRLKKAIYGLKQAPLGLEYSGVRQRLQRGAADVKSGEMLLSCYTDASFNSVKADGTSIGGYVCLLGGGAVSWRSKKQNEVGLSSCETEYMALHHGAKEVVWLRRLLEELGVGQEKPTVVFCDNESAVKLAKNACLHGLTKHIRPKWHWVRRLLDKEVRLEIVKTHQQAADIFTKRLAEADHWKGMKLAGMSVH